MQITIDELVPKSHATIILERGDDYTIISATFRGYISYVDDSFDHAFGIHHDHHFELELDNVKLKVVEVEGEPINYNEFDVIQAIYDEFDENYGYTEAYLRDIKAF